MTRSTIDPQLTGMMIIFLMAGETILRRGFQPSQTARAQVTIAAAGLSVQPGQLEREQVMVEVRPECIDPIMTVETVRSKLKRVDLSFLRLHYVMTVYAFGRIKHIIFARVAIGTGKCFTIRFFLMGFEREFQTFMRKVHMGHIHQRSGLSTVLGVALDAFQRR